MPDFTSESRSASASEGSVSRLLTLAAHGDRTAHDELFDRVYEELRRIARSQRRRWEPAGDDTLNTTALVHETYIKLMGPAEAEWEHRGHFFAVAAKAMRQILIDQARRAAAAKRGGDRQRVTLDAVERAITSPGDISSPELAETILALDRSLKRLERQSRQHSRIVECRFFGGMTIADTAQALGISPATVKRGWALARSWLYHDLQDQLG